MLAKRIIPCLDIDRGRVVKGVKFGNLRDAGSPVKNALFYEKENADELVFLDITASYQKRKTILNLVREVAEVIFIPFTVGGGISTAQDIRKILLAGADKVSLNTAAVKDPALIKKVSKIFGSQCIVIAIDAKRNPKQKKKWEVYIHGGRTPTGLDAIAWAKKVEKLGAGEILLTSIDYDGTTNGFDIKLIKEVSEAVKIPVIASGGAGAPEHFVEVFKKTKAAAALAASIFHYRKYRIKEIKRYLKEKQIEVRE
ncbi:MAG: imidazole glycerol phosphate synthase subunit HisF [Candidatus Omnitrophica bacterium]|nr:imidazole glycerol phosphate synthase subunit HisF [Candidatus Omnitrophota bacterium]